MNFNINKKQFDIVSFIVILSGAVFLLLRAPYGFFFNDEPFYVTLAQRLYLGDSLIINEWNAGQCVGSLIYPFYAIFHLVSGDNVGILLTFRYVYCVLWFSACLVVFIVLRKKYKTSLLVFLYLVLFSPLDYMTLSYTSLSLISIISICLLFYYTFEYRYISSWIFSIIFSIFSCVLVLCYPFMAAVYVIGIPIALISIHHFKSTYPDKYRYWLKTLLRSIIIIAIIAILFLMILIVRGSSLSEVLDKFVFSIPFVFSSPEHGDVMSAGSILKSIIRIISFSRLYTLIILFAVLFYFVSIYSKRLKFLRFPVYLIACAYYLICQIRVCTNFDILTHNTLNQQVLGIVYLGLLSYLYLDNKPKKLFWCFVPASLVYALITSLSSNTGIIVLAMSLSLSGIPSIIFISLLFNQYRKNYSKTLVRNAVSLILITIMTVQIGSELYVRLSRFYWDAPMRELTQRIDVGAGKGIFTTAQNKEEYEKDYFALTTLLGMLPEQPDSEDRFLSLKASPILYLDADMPFGIYSSWSFRMTPEWLAQYYKINPSANATLIFTDSETDCQFEKYFNVSDYSALEYENYKLYFKEK